MKTNSILIAETIAYLLSWLGDKYNIGLGDLPGEIPERLCRVMMERKVKPIETNLDTLPTEKELNELADWLVESYGWHEGEGGTHEALRHLVHHRN